MSPADIKTANGYLEFMWGDMLSLDGRPDKGIAELNRAIEANPSDAFPYYLRAQAHIAIQDAVSAEADCVKALELSPKLVQAQVLLARLYVVKNEFNKAVPLLVSALATKPSDPEIYSLLAHTYAATNKPTQAIAVLKRLLVIDPDSNVAHFYLGSIYSAQGRTADALTMYRKILANDPRNVSVYNAIAQMYVDEKQPRKAVAVVEEAERLGVQDVSLKLRLSSLYYQLKDLPRAAQVLENVLKTNPNADKVRYYLGVIYEESGNFKAAQVEYNRIGVGSGYYKDAVLRQVLHYHKAGEPAVAVSLLEAGVIKRPATDEFYQLLAVLYEELDNLPAARLTLQKAVAANPKNAVLMYALGVVDDRLKRTDEAVQVMRKVIVLDPQNASALNYVGYSLSEKGVHLDEAEDLLLKAVALRPNDGYIVDSLGWLYYRKAEYEKALIVLRQALQILPQEAVIYRHLAEVCAALNRKDEAIAYYREAIALAELKLPTDRGEVDVDAMQAAVKALEAK